MAIYLYKVRDANGVERADYMEGSDDFYIASELRRRGYTIVSIEKKKEKIYKEQFLPFQTASQQEIILLTRQISRMLKSGLPITTALRSIIAQSDNRFFI